MAEPDERESDSSKKATSKEPSYQEQNIRRDAQNASGNSMSTNEKNRQNSRKNPTNNKNCLNNNQFHGRHTLNNSKQTIREKQSEQESAKLLSSDQNIRGKQILQAKQHGQSASSSNQSRRIYTKSKEDGAARDNHREPQRKLTYNKDELYRHNGRWKPWEKQKNDHQEDSNGFPNYKRRMESKQFLHDNSRPTPMPIRKTYKQSEQFGDKQDNNALNHNQQQKHRRINEQEDSNTKKRAVELVGVVTHCTFSEEDCVEFLVYHFKQRRFAYSIPVKTQKLPACNPGVWLRLVFTDPVNLAQMNDCRHRPLAPHRAIPCQRRVITRTIDGQVNFLVPAKHKKNQTTDQSPDKIIYESRLCTLSLDKTDLIEPNSVENDNEIPGRIRLWCYPSVEHDDDQHQLKFILKRIEERFYIAQAGDEKGDDSNASLSDDEKEGESREKKLSVEFGTWFNELIKRYYEEYRMSDKRQNEIDEFVGKLENLLRDELNLPQINLELFGSVKSGFGDDSCDLDICLVDTGIPMENQKKYAEQKRRILTRLTEKLRANNEFDQVISVLDARTPIVKFEHKPSGFHGDISIENTLAIYNTILLNLYTQFDERVAPLGFAIKSWAKMCGLNDASCGSISSYAYIVMLIHYLQRCQPPILPFLQEQQTDPLLPKGLVEGWAVQFCRDIQPLRELPEFANHQTTTELFHGFMHYYGRKFCFINDVAQIRTSQKYTKQIREAKASIKKKLCVEDPFDLHHNLTSGVQEETLHYFLKCLHATERGLLEYDERHFSPEIIATETEEESTSQKPQMLNGQDQEQENAKMLSEMTLPKLLSMFKQRRVIYVKKSIKKKKKKPSNGDDEEKGNEKREEESNEEEQEDSMDLNNKKQKQNGLPNDESLKSTKAGEKIEEGMNTAEANKMVMNKFQHRREYVNKSRRKIPEHVEKPAKKQNQQQIGSSQEDNNVNNKGIKTHLTQQQPGENGAEESAQKN